MNPGPGLRQSLFEMSKHKISDSKEGLTFKRKKNSELCRILWRGGQGGRSGFVNKGFIVVPKKNIFSNRWWWGQV